MHPVWALAGAIIGVAAATALRRPTFVLAVAPGEPDRLECPGCGLPPMRLIPAWHGRCVHCSLRIGPRWASVELLSAVLCAGVALVLGASFQAIGVIAMVVIGVALAVIDLHSFRLPNKLIGLATLLLAVSLAAAAATGGGWPRLQAGLSGAAGLSVTYLLLALIRPGALGLGDVKLAVPLGLLLGWFGWPFVVFGGCLAFLLSALTILLLLWLRKITLRSQIPFGPFMLAGTLLALLL